MRATLQLTLLIVTWGMFCTADAQFSHPPRIVGGFEVPDNNYATEVDYFLPDTRAGYQVCAEIVTPNGMSPQPDVPVLIQSYTTLRSGYHGHETIPGTQRPQVQFLGPIGGKTGADGCFRVGWRLPGVSGYYTFEGIVVGGGTLGTNLYAKFPPTMAALLPYPNDTTVNAPQFLHVDAAHGGQSRYTDTVTAGKIYTSSNDYHQTSLDKFGIESKVDVIRCSLPHGGLADNYEYGFSNWYLDTPAHEEHPYGTECDIANPAFDGQAQGFARVTMLFSKFSDRGCYPGAFAPNTHTRLPGRSNNYWAVQPVIHMTCGPSPLQNGRAIQ